MNQLRTKTKAVLVSGFTLIELLVVTGIIVVISAIVLANNGRFGGVILLENLAYDVALSIREAQVYGISVASFQSNQTNVFTAGYGVHFDLSSPDTYILFADVANKGTFALSADSGEIVSTTAIPSGYSVYGLCVPASVTTENCSITKLDIAFRHPEPDAWISTGDVSCAYGNGSCAESAMILLRSPRGDTMGVAVYANGQISVSKGAQ